MSNLSNIDNKQVFDENPEWTDEMFEKATFGQASAIRHLGDKEKNLLKQKTIINLSSDVMDYFRATGNDWQTRIDDVLKEYVAEHS